MTDPIWNLPNAELDAELEKLPSVVTWSRVEPLTLTPDLTPGLQMLLSDPLWMLARQWQFGEFQGEDAGTPISAVVELQQAPLSRLQRGDQAPVDLLNESIPLEARIEAEPVTVPAERIRAEAGLQLLRQLSAAGLGTLRSTAVDLWGFRGGAAIHRGRVPNADRAAAEIRALPNTPNAMPDGFEPSTAARAVLDNWLRWYDDYLVHTDGAAWNPHRQEYRFAVHAELPAGTVRFAADEYTTGRVDWPDFNASIGQLGPTPSDRSGTTSVQVSLPAPATFPGMAADRLWEFEDSRVYLGGIEAGPTDLARMALVEFSLAYGVDWFVLPLDVTAGSALWVHQLEVIDTFGRTTLVNGAGQPNWSMFSLATPGEQTFAANVFIVPPVVTHLLESDPLEEVALFRDEMANLVWGVERVVQGADGRPVNRAREASAVSVRTQVPGDLGDAAIAYRLMTPVPDHWAPFVAVPAPEGGVELERRPLLHFREDGTTDVTHPIGVLLNEGGPRLRLAEEEVPSDGAVVIRRYQLARTPDGGTALWIGRRKRVGEGEGWSGLRFDTALPPFAG
ncbi:MAG: hypothetical protein ABW328_11535 [Ilumatobacteraceae bacterium]